MEKGHPRNWYKKKKTESRMRQCASPYGNIYIGSDPLDGMTKEKANSFDAIVNVSCSECALFYPSYDGQAMYWIPVHEMGVWNYSAFIQFARIMDFHHNKKHKIYVHCHAGAYRSPTMTMIWLKATQQIWYFNKEWKQKFRRDMTWKEADAVTQGLSLEKYNEKFKDTRFRLKYFRGNMPKNFNLFIARLSANRKLSYMYPAIMDGPMGRLSNDRECRAMIQGYRLSSRLRRPFYKIGSLYRNLKDWWRRLLVGRKMVKIADHMSSTIDGDDWLRTMIRKYRGENTTEY